MARSCDDYDRPADFLSDYRFEVFVDFSNGSYDDKCADSLNENHSENETGLTSD